MISPSNLRLAFAVVTVALTIFSSALGGPAPANDNFADAMPIFGNPALGTSVIDFATREAGEAPLVTDAVTAGQTIWWKWQAPADGRVLLYVTNTAVWPAIAIFQGPSLLSAVPISLTQPSPRPVFSNWVVSIPSPPADPSAELCLFPAKKGGTCAIGLDATQRPRWVPPPEEPPFITCGEVTLPLSFLSAYAGDSLAEPNTIPSSASSFRGQLNGGSAEVGEPLQAGAIGRTL